MGSGRALTPFLRILKKLQHLDTSKGFFAQKMPSKFMAQLAVLRNELLSMDAMTRVQKPDFVLP